MFALFLSEIALSTLAISLSSASICFLTASFDLAISFSLFSTLAFWSLISFSELINSNSLSSHFFLFSLSFAASESCFAFSRSDFALEICSKTEDNLSLSSLFLFWFASWLLY
ncbi:hypothetical protein [Metamycoplasma equirhinis]|uniref:hypothetical protein n=1 Tax=Metamycoplasma equirhinis TaxID=92402 RepID=UPI0035945493